MTRLRRQNTSVISRFKEFVFTLGEAFGLTRSIENRAIAETLRMQKDKQIQILRARTQRDQLSESIQQQSKYNSE